MNLAELFKMQRLLDERIIKKHNLMGQRLLEKKYLALEVEIGELANELPEVFKFWSNKKNNYEKALKEYVDGLHFILSIGLEFGFNNKVLLDLTKYKDHVLLKQFSLVYEAISKLKSETFFKRDWYEFLFDSYLALGCSLGFTLEQIEQAYFAKNEINHIRQDEGY